MLAGDAVWKREADRASVVAQLRTHDGLFACSGTFYNHKSERRPEAFVSRKITRAVAAIKLRPGQGRRARRCERGPRWSSRRRGHARCLG